MKILNCSGLLCPQPVLKCRDYLIQEKPDTVCVLVDNEPSSINVQRFLEQHNFSAQVEKKDAIWRITGQLRQGEARREPTAGQHPHAAAEGVRKIIVFITSEHMGSGDDTLGAKLMENFLLTLPEMGDDLWRVILLNGGVKLAAKPGGALESLQRLEKAGVTVLVCGTCLAHFGLSEQKAVGDTSNMLDIATSMTLADMVIRP